MSLPDTCERAGLVQTSHTQNFGSDTLCYEDRDRGTLVSIDYFDEAQLDLVKIDTLALGERAHLNINLLKTGPQRPVTLRVKTLHVEGFSTINVANHIMCFDTLRLTDSEITNLTIRTSLNLTCFNSQMHNCRISHTTQPEMNLTVRRSELSHIHIQSGTPQTTYVEYSDLSGPPRDILLTQRATVNRQLSIFHAGVDRDLVLTSYDPTGTILNLQGKPIPYNLLTEVETGQPYLTLGCWSGTLDDFETLIEGPADRWPSHHEDTLDVDSMADQARTRYRALLALLRVS